MFFQNSGKFWEGGKTEEKDAPATDADKIGDDGGKQPNDLSQTEG